MGNLITKNVKDEKIKKELDAVSEKIQKSKLKFSDLLIPLLVSTVLIMLGVFVFVPMIKTAMSSRVEYKAIKEKEAKLVKLESTLEKMDEGILQADLINAKDVIPKTLKVSSFIYYIDNLAYEKKLSSQEISAGDIKISNGEKKSGKYILGVSGPLSYSGELENILSFLESIYSASPYIISAENISLKETGSGWKVELNVTGYYVPENIDEYSLYDEFTPYTNESSIVTIFESKAARLD